MRHLALPPHITDITVSMAPKLSSETRKANLAKARETSTATSLSAQSDHVNALAVSQEIFARAKAQMISLEVELENLYKSLRAEHRARQCTDK